MSAKKLALAASVAVATGAAALAYAGTVRVPADHCGFLCDAAALAAATAAVTAANATAGPDPTDVPTLPPAAVPSAFVRVGPLAHGFHFFRPFSGLHAAVVPLRDETTTVRCPGVLTQDGQRLDIDVAVTFRPASAARAADALAACGGVPARLASATVGPALDGVVRWAVSDYLTSEVVGVKQGEVAWVVRDLTGARLARCGLVVAGAVRVARVSFSEA